MGEDYAEITRRYLFGTWRYQKTWNPKVIVGAEGSYFEDIEGKRYLDFSSQLVCSNLGHDNQKVREALSGQGEKLLYISPGFTTAFL